MVVTYSVPFFTNTNGKKEFKGVAISDISLEWLSTLIKEINSYGSDYAFILSQSGKIICFPFSEYLCNYTVFEYAKQTNNPTLANIGKEMLAGKSNFTYMYSSMVKKTGWLYYTPIGNHGWSLAVFFPDDKLNQDLRKLNFEMLSICLAGVVLLMVIIFFITSKLTLPLRRLTHSVRVIGRGKLDTKIETTKNNDEVGVLTRSFDDMRTSLINYIENLRKTTAEKESFETELRIAASIQNSVLPVIDDKFKSNLYELYVKLVPAKEVSGDFYDLFFLDDETLSIVIADVSGKGFPAAFFMSMSKFAIKNACLTMKNPSPGKVLEVANNLIYRENASDMFLTCYLIFYNVKTGHLFYANAGHHNMIHTLHNGKIEEKGLLDNPAIGFFPDAEYKNGELILEKDEILSLFTDGIIEAFSEDEVQFGDEKIVDHFTKNCKKPIKIIGDSLVNNVLEFENHHRFDDITLLILKRN